MQYIWYSIQIFIIFFCTCTRKHICARNQNHIDLELSIILINTRARENYGLAFTQSHVHLFNTQHLQVTTIHNFLVLPSGQRTMHTELLNEKSLGPFRPVRPAGLDFQTWHGPARGRPGPLPSLVYIYYLILILTLILLYQH